MDISIDKTEKNAALIKVKVNEEDYQQGVTQKIKDFSKKANLKGFRPGKVPPGLIRKMYGQSFLVEEINKMLSENLSKYIREHELQFLGEPLPVKEEMESIDWENQKEFQFTYDAGYASDFDLKVDKKLKVDHAKIKVDKQVIDETVENLQIQFGEPSPTEVVEANDAVVGGIKSEAAALDREITIDLKACEKAGNSKLIGSKIGDEIKIDGKKFFKDPDYIVRLAGLTADQAKDSKNKFEFTVKGITHTTPAEVNQDLFDKTFGKDSIKSEDEFRAKVEETISQNYIRESDQYLFHKIKETLTEKAKIALPDGFLKKWLLATNETMTDEVIEAEYTQYAKELKWSLISNRIAKDHDVKVEHPEVLNEAKNQIVQQFGGGAIVEQLGDQLDQFADNYLKGENGDNYMKVYNQVQAAKIFEFVKEQISLKEKEVSADEFRKLV